MKRLLIAIATMTAAAQLHAGEIASRFLCTDGTIIRLETNAGPRVTITWNGYRFPVDEIKPSYQGVLISGGIPKQTTALIQPLWLDNPIQSPFFGTFITNPNGEAYSTECSPDRGSNRLQY